MPRHEKLSQIGLQNSTPIMAIDVGGSSLKWSFVCPDARGVALTRKEFQNSPIASRDTRDRLIARFAETIRLGLEKGASEGLQIGGVGFAMPGPFDYKAGVSYMTDEVQKYEALYNVDLREELKNRLGLEEDFPIKFYNDAEMFLLGEAFEGAAKGFDRIVGLTLGTGIGYAAIAEKRIIREGRGVPPKVALYALPYQGGIVEDSVSRHALLQKYGEISGTTNRAIDIKDIALLAQNGDPNALNLFEILDEMLCDILTPILTEFHADCLVLGGQISKSFSLFSKRMQERLGRIPTLRKITTSSLWELAAIVGVGRVFWTDFQSVYFE